MLVNVMIVGGALAASLKVYQENKRKKETPWTVYAEKFSKSKKKHVPRNEGWASLVDKKGILSQMRLKSRFDTMPFVRGLGSVSSGGGTMSIAGDALDLDAGGDSSERLRQLYFALQEEKRRLQSLLQSGLNSVLLFPKTVYSALAPSPDSEIVKSLKYLWVYGHSQWRYVLLAVPCTLAPTLFGAYFALGLKGILDSIVITGSSATLLPLVGGILLAFPITAVLSVVGERLSTNISSEISSEIRTELFYHLQELPLAFFNNTQLGDIVSRFAVDVEHVEILMLDLIKGLASVLGLLITIPMLFYLQPSLALLTITFFPLVTILTRRITTRVTDSSYQCRQSVGKILNTLQENIRGQAIVKALSIKEWQARLHKELLYDYKEKRDTLVFETALLKQASNLPLIFMELLVMYSGAWLVSWHLLSVSSLIAYAGLLSVVNKEFKTLGTQIFSKLVGTTGSVRRIEELFQEIPQLTDAPNAIALTEFSKELCFEDVSFAYNEEQMILNQVNLTIPTKQYIAFVGPSGTGKSTILNLILRFYDVKKGRITIDGHDIRDVTQASLRGLMSVVFQTPFLFDISILENIRVSKQDATIEEIEAAAKEAEIHDFIVSLPQGYQTRVGEAGGRLSGGQRQRISIARALLRQPSILILDEPTASLDAATAAQISKTLESLSKERTVISVTHHLSSVVQADQIFVINAGEVAERGTHSELLAQQGQYYHLWQKQQHNGATHTSLMG